MKRVIWIIQFIALCLAEAPKNSAIDTSCPCRFFYECRGNSYINAESVKASELSCEKKNFIRCCSVTEKTLVFKHVDSFSQTSDTFKNDGLKKQTDRDQKLVEFIQTRASSLINENRRREEEQEKPAGLLEPELLANAIRQLPAANYNNTKTQVSSDQLNTIGRKIFEHAKHVMTVIDDDQAQPTISAPRSKQMAKLKEIALKPIHVKTLDHLRTRIQVYPSDPSNFTVGNSAVAPEKVSAIMKNKYFGFIPKGKQQLDFRQAAEELIDFESFRVSPKREQSKYELPVEKSLKGTLSSEEKPEFLTGSKNVAEKISSFSEQKTLLSTLSTVDRTITQVVDENKPKPSRKLDISDDDVLIENALVLGNIEDIKRLVRSNSENPDKLTTEADVAETSETGVTEDNKNHTIVTQTDSQKARDNGKATARVPSRRFKRPSRISSKRGTQNQQQKSLPRLEITQDYKQRMLDLLNRSSEKTRSRASLIINRNNVKIHRVPFVNNSSPVAIRPINSTRLKGKDQIDSSETTTKENQINLLQMTTESTSTVVTVSRETEHGELARNR